MGVLGSTAAFDDCAAFPATTGCCSLGKFTFLFAVQGLLCGKRELPRPETWALVSMYSFVCSLTVVWIVRALLCLVLVFCLPQLVPGCSGCWSSIECSFWCSSLVSLQILLMSLSLADCCWDFWPAADRHKSLHDLLQWLDLIQSRNRSQRIVVSPCS